MSSSGGAASTVSSRLVIALATASLKRVSSWKTFIRMSLSSTMPTTSPFLSSTGSRSEEHTSELQSLMRISYAVFCLKKKKQTNNITHNNHVKVNNKSNHTDNVKR